MPQPRSVVSSRPQTSRQAKRAYQKAGATPRISAAEQRRIDRAVELEDRAARIRLHNVRARENKRKKAERDEKDRETRKRMGIPEPSKFKIGPSQLSLGSFVGVAPKHRKPEPIKDEVPECSFPYTPVETTKAEDTNMDCPDVPRTLENPDCVNLETTGVPSDPLEDGRTSQHKVDPSKSPSEEIKSTTMVPSTTLMPPPPRPSRASSRINVSNSVPTTCTQPSKPMATSAATESDWDIFLDSNTQVEREISCHPANPPMPPADKRPTPDTAIQQSVTSQADLLAGISTQDLQYCSSPSTSKFGSDKNAEFLGGIEDEDLSDVNVAAFVDCSDPPPPHNKQLTAVPHIERWTTVEGAVYSSFTPLTESNTTGAFSRMDEFDDYGISSQELLQLVA
ncbi:MAG: hypothetical protein L6R36_009158 [Xanthoria steineri]|nr:MAG: hypothetical protein L6R36_009158 [Xanthoria steineri]